jgi:hypothetical protein
VKRESLKLEDNSAHALIDSVPFWWNGGISGYGWLKRTFTRAEVGFNRNVLRELGGRLFDRADMHDVAARIKALGPLPAWRKAAPRLGASNQKQILAGVGNDLAVFCRRATSAFWELLGSGGRSVQDVGPGRLRQGAWREVAFRSATMQGFREPFDRFLSEVGRYPRRALIQLHCAVWERRGHDVPWVRLRNGRVQVRPDIEMKLPPPESEWDLRWGVAHRLISRTGWRPK